VPSWLWIVMGGTSWSRGTPARDAANDSASPPASDASTGCVVPESSVVNGAMASTRRVATLELRRGVRGDARRGRFTTLEPASRGTARSCCARWAALR
jgi:hypothetical protein